jgi:[acyl-carrier-protein] S-malonyltransferase
VTVAILCSGQGRQHPAMFDLAAESPAAEPIFAEATRLLGKDPRRFVREAAPAELFSNGPGQILCCTQALAIWAVLGELCPTPVVIAGYSVGELAAWGCAGCLDAPSILRLARQRAALMDADAGGGLAAVVGLRRSTLEPILAPHAVSIAIINGVDSFVIGGSHEGLKAACRDAVSRGAKHIVELPVGVPSHTPLLARATERFRPVLREAAPRPPRAGYRLLSGIDGDTVRDVESGMEKLARQISTAIDWAGCLESCRSAGARAALELGPGSALSHMASALLSEGRVRAVDDFRTLAGLTAWLQRAADG